MTRMPPISSTTAKAVRKTFKPFRAKAGVKLLDYSNDEDHNRLVITLVGEPEALYEAVSYTHLDVYKRQTFNFSL